MADGILAVLGAPRAVDDHAEQALRAAQATLKAVKQILLSATQPSNACDLSPYAPSAS